MEYNIDKNMLRGFLQQMDLMHTLNGGSSMTSVDVAEKEDSILITIAAPSVKAEAFNVSIERSKLIVYAALTSKNTVAGGEFSIPMFFKTFDIPYYVDGTQINAVFEDKILKVVLPFGEKSQDLQRKIDIQHS